MPWAKSAESSKSSPSKSKPPLPEPAASNSAKKASSGLDITAAETDFAQKAKWCCEAAEKAAA
jgi:hypothetical protein